MTKTKQKPVKAYGLVNPDGTLAPCACSTPLAAAVMALPWQKVVRVEIRLRERK